MTKAENACRAVLPSGLEGPLLDQLPSGHSVRIYNGTGPFHDEDRDNQEFRCQAVISPLVACQVNHGLHEVLWIKGYGNTPAEAFRDALVAMERTKALEGFVYPQVYEATEPTIR